MLHGVGLYRATPNFTQIAPQHGREPHPRVCSRPVVHGLPVLRDLVILLAVAIPVAAIAHRVRLPTVVGFLLAGVAIGPHGFALVSRPEAVAELAGLGGGLPPL